MATILKAADVSGAFPTANVEACIRTALQEQADTQSVLRPPAPSRPAWQPEIDSLAVVEVICSIEELLGVTLPASFVPRGGYDDVEACVRDLLTAAQTVWIDLTKKEEVHA
jgi:acyl carrier protein